MNKANVMCLLVAVGVSFVVVANAQIPLETTTCWTQSGWFMSTARGSDLADVNGDGALDFAVANESDVDGAQLYLNTNNVNMFDTIPSWISTEKRQFLHCAFGDVNNDGWPDLAVSDAGAGGGGAWVRVYMNRGGTLETTASWVSDTLNPFPIWIGWGDVNGDGYPDLAVISFFGSAPAVFLNRGGVLESSPSWRAQDPYNEDRGGAWGDIDNDGRLDLFVVSGQIQGAYPTRVYRNTGDSLESSASWTAASQDVGAGGCLADIDGNGYLDAVVGCDPPFSPGPLQVYMNYGGTLDPNPWSSIAGYNFWRVSAADADNDGYPDIAGGGYTGLDTLHGGRGVQIFRNLEGQLEYTASWRSVTRPGAFGVSWGDLDRQSLNGTVDNVPGDGTRKLFYLRHWPANSLSGITINGNPLPRSDYCYDLSAGWVSLKNAPPNGSTVGIEYVWSPHLDLAVSGDNSGPYPFHSIYRHYPVGVEEKREPTPQLQGINVGVQSPVRDHLVVNYTLSRDGAVQIELYDAIGRKMGDLFCGLGAKGKAGFKRKINVPAGVYFLHLKADGESAVRKVVVVR